MHFHAWSNGLKTGMYYLRSQAATNATQFTVDPTLIKNEMKKAAETPKKSSNDRQSFGTPSSSTYSTSTPSSSKHVVAEPIEHIKAVPVVSSEAFTPIVSKVSTPIPTEVSTPIVPITPAIVNSEPLTETPSITPIINTRSDSGDGSSSDEADVLAWRLQREKHREAMECSLKNPGACLSCGS
jgi:hypothetical protein